MKHVDIEFINIQSHEHTKFHLGPGLNFILAEDNNVGKSTIFKVLMCAMRLPQIDAVDPNELIRGGCSMAKAIFSFDNVTHTLWMFREPRGTARTFFETVDADGTTTRSLSAPADLVDAFDIVKSEDGKVINFNDADSVQLVVEDTPKNDEVLSKVLIEMRVETIKENAIRLSREIAQDYKVVFGKNDMAKRSLEQMHYCSAVPTFKEEYDILRAGCSVLDLIEAPAQELLKLPPAPDVATLNQVETALYTVERLVRVPVITAPTKQVDMNALDETFRSLDVLVALSKVQDSVCAPIPAKALTNLTTTEHAVSVLQSVSNALAAMSRAFNSGARADSIHREIQEIKKDIAEACPRVQCPIKGEVFYTDEKCIPVDD